MEESGSQVSGAGQGDEFEVVQFPDPGLEHAGHRAVAERSDRGPLAERSDRREAAHTPWPWPQQTA